MAELGKRQYDRLSEKEEINWIHEIITPVLKMVKLQEWINQIERAWNRKSQDSWSRIQVISTEHRIRYL